MALFDDLKKKALGVYHQVTPFDHGQTYSTTVNNVRPGAPAAPRMNLNQPQLRVSQPIQTPKISITQPSMPKLATPQIQTPKIATVKVAPQQNLRVGNINVNPSQNVRTGVAAPQPTATLREKAGAFGTGVLSGAEHAAANTVKTASDVRFLTPNFVPGVSRYVDPAINRVSNAASKPFENASKGFANVGVQRGYNMNKATNSAMKIGNAVGQGTVYVPQAVNAARDIAIAAPKAVNAVKTLPKTVEGGINAIGKGAHNLDQAAFSTPATRQSKNELRTLSDYADYKMGRYKPDIPTTNKLISDAYKIGDKHVIDVRRGSAQDIQDRITAHLENMASIDRGIERGGAKAGDIFPKKFFKDGNPDSNHPETPADMQEALARLKESTTKHSGSSATKANVSDTLPSPESIYPDAEERIFAKNPLSAENAQLDRVPTSVGDVLDARTTAKLESSQRSLPQSSLQEPGRTLPNDATATNNRPLPIHNTKLVSKLDKATRSARSIIERQGEHGKNLAKLLQDQRDNKELYLAQLQKQMPTVFKIANPKALRTGVKDQWTNKTFENFIHATQGLEKPKNELVAKAVSEWRAVHPTIRERGINAGLDIGDLGTEYYPHFIDYQKIFSDVNTKNAAINHLIETGQATDQEDALQKLARARDVSRNRAFGNLEASRMLDLPMYDKTPNSLINYLSSSANRITQAESFGKQDEKALNLIAKAARQGYDTEAMQNAYNVSVGAKQYNPTASAVSAGIRKYITTTRLGLGALTNSAQGINTGIVTGHMRTLASAFKQLDPKTRAFVGDTGVIADAVLNDLRSQSGVESFSSKVFGKLVNKMTAPGFSQVEKFNRSVAATAGRDYALRLAQKGDEATLRNLGVTGPIKNKTLTEAQQIQAARKIVEKTQFKVDPQDLPGWADSPGGKLVAQFRTFSYKQGSFVSNEILKPAAHGDLMPLGRFLAALPLGYALYETKRVISGRPEEENKSKVALQTAQNIGGFGLAFDLYQSLNPLGSKYIPSDRRTSMTFGAAGGPAVGVAAQGFGAVSDLIQRKNTPTDESRLQGKVVIGKTPDSYTDATPAARFAIQQLPVVGTAIKNRLLPFQKESNADAGKPTGTAAITGDNLTVDQRIKQAFTTPEAKKFLALSPADQKALASTDPAAAQLYSDIQSARKAFSAPPVRPIGLNADYAKQTLGLDNFDPTKILDHYAHLSDKAKEAEFNKKNDAEFNLKVAQYLQDNIQGNISEIDQLKKQNELAKLFVGKDFDKTTRDFYGLNKTQLYNYLTTNNNGKALADKILAYDDALTKAGVQQKNKFRDKYGNPDFDPASNGKGGGKGGGGTKDAVGIAKALYTKPETVKLTTYKFGHKKLGGHKVRVKKGKKVSVKVKV